MKHLAIPIAFVVAAIIAVFYNHSPEAQFVAGRFVYFMKMLLTF
jgi:hypothetical protein